MYYDLLVKIKNAQRARKDSFQVAFSQFDFDVAKLLAQAGFVESVNKKTVGKKHAIDIKLRYRAGEPAMSDFRVWSKPSRRLYRGYRDLKPVRQHFGLAVLSTPSGVMTNKDARVKKVGGEYLFEIW